MRTLEPERTFVVRDGGADRRQRGDAVAHDDAARRRGGPGRRRVRPSACGPGHTRRGHLGALMRSQLDEIHAAGEPLAILWASEGAIYGRFGYGSATRRVTYEVLRLRAAFRADVAAPGRRPAQLPRPPTRSRRCATPTSAPGATRAGMLDRDDRWWERLLHDPEHRRDGTRRTPGVVQPRRGRRAGRLRALRGRRRPGATRAPRAASRPRAGRRHHRGALGLWRYLLSIDLMRTVSWSAGARPRPDRLRAAQHGRRPAHPARPRTVAAPRRRPRRARRPRVLRPARRGARARGRLLPLEHRPLPPHERRLRADRPRAGPRARGRGSGRRLSRLHAAHGAGGHRPRAGAHAGRAKRRPAAFAGFPEPYCPEHF